MLQKNPPFLWRKLSNLPKLLTNNCKICFNPIEENMFHRLSIKPTICSQCLSNLKPYFKFFNFYGYKALALYEYKDKVREILYLYKGCLDYELVDSLIFPYKNELKILFNNYIIIPVPSNDEAVKKRGFNHVYEMFKFLDLKIIDCLKKDLEQTQHLSSYKIRKNMGKHIYFSFKPEIFDKKILIVDDVLTTGSTMKACLDLIKTLNPKEIKILLFSKREFNPANKNKNIHVIH